MLVQLRQVPLHVSLGGFPPHPPPSPQGMTRAGQGACRLSGCIIRETRLGTAIAFGKFTSKGSSAPHHTEALQVKPTENHNTEDQVCDDIVDGVSAAGTRGSHEADNPPPPKSGEQGAPRDVKGVRNHLHPIFRRSSGSGSGRGVGRGRKLSGVLAYRTVPYLHKDMMSTGTGQLPAHVCDTGRIHHASSHPHCIETVVTDNLVLFALLRCGELQSEMSRLT